STSWLRPNNSFKPEAASRLGLIQALAPKPRFIVILAIAAFCSGCGVGVNRLTRLKAADLSVGDTVSLRSDAVIYECEPRDTSSEFWFASAKTKRCLESTSSVTQYDKIV